MTTQDEPAFPTPDFARLTTTQEGPDYDAQIEAKGGLTKLEHFAGLAMQGYLAGRNNAAANRGDDSTCEFCAATSVKYAAALLDEIEKRSGAPDLVRCALQRLLTAVEQPAGTQPTETALAIQEARRVLGL